MFVVANGFAVDSLLPALVTRGAIGTVVDLVRASLHHLDMSCGTVAWDAIQLDGKAVLFIQGHSPTAVWNWKKESKLTTQTSLCTSYNAPQRRYDMRHEMLPSRAIQTGYAESQRML